MSCTIAGITKVMADDAFSGCSRLKRVTMGKSVTSIGNEAFEGCSRLKSVTFENPNGWVASSIGSRVYSLSASGLSDPATAARYLTDIYVSDSWERK